MKKAIIIVIIIAIVIVAGSILLKESTEKALEVVETKQSEVQIELQNALMKLTTRDISILIDDWFVNNTTKFEDNGNNLTEVGRILSVLKNEQGIDAKYHIYTTGKNYVVKLQAMGADKFYCMDTVTAIISAEIVSIEGINFESNLNCRGVELL